MKYFCAECLRPVSQRCGPDGVWKVGRCSLHPWAKRVSPALRAQRLKAFYEACRAEIEAASPVGLAIRDPRITELPQKPWIESEVAA